MKLLYPFSVVYGLIVFIRNKLFDFGLFKQKSFSIPIISVGNLSLGGTGKTPHIEFIIEKYNNSKKIAVVSRGYGRKTKGFRYVETTDNTMKSGDEPLQIKNKFNDIIVAVCENRVYAIEKILKEFPQTDLILLDDAFQHRYVKRDLNILLTSYQKPFWKDCVLPCGTLREFNTGFKRADMIIITKCPKVKNLKIPQNILIKPLFFSEIFFESPILVSGAFSKKVIVITGIANDKHFIEYLKNEDYEIIHHFKFSDHHNFNATEIENINLEINKSPSLMILTTEKDYMRLKTFYKTTKNNLAYIPIKVKLNKDLDFLSLCNKANHQKL